MSKESRVDAAVARLRHLRSAREGMTSVLRQIDSVFNEARDAVRWQAATARLGLLKNAEADARRAVVSSLPVENQGAVLKRMIVLHRHNEALAKLQRRMTVLASDGSSKAQRLFAEAEAAYARAVKVQQEAQAAFDETLSTALARAGSAAGSAFGASLSPAHHVAHWREMEEERLAAVRRSLDKQ